MTTHSFKSLSTLLLPLFLFLSHTHATLPLDASSLFFLSPSQHFALSHHRRSLSRSLSHTLFGAAQHTLRDRVRTALRRDSADTILLRSPTDRSPQTPGSVPLAGGSSFRSPVCHKCCARARKIAPIVSPLNAHKSSAENSVKNRRRFQQVSELFELNYLY